MSDLYILKILEDTMKRINSLALSLFVFFLSTNIFAQIPRIINYQGMLLGSNEQPVAEGDYKLTFNLYDEADNLLWSEEHTNVYVAGGMFHVLLGTVSHLGIPFDKPYLLGIQVGNDPELQPRMMLTSASYSFRADDANTVAGMEASKTPQPNTLLALDNDGKFPAEVLPTGGPSGNYLKKNEPDSSSATHNSPVLLISNKGSGDGIKGEGTNGRAIVGSSENNDGLVGWTNASDKSGVYGSSPVGNGVAGRSDAVSGRGVSGRATAGSGQGVYGDATGADGVGVYGRSTNGIGVEGRTASTNEWEPAIYGKSVGAGDGVYGWSQSRHGTFGVTSSQNTAHAGVYGTNNGAGPAIKADGDLVVTGEYKGNIGPNNGAPFPRPAYDSGWTPIARNEKKTLNHNVGGNVDNYVVDMSFKSSYPAVGINNAHYGGQTTYYDGSDTHKVQGADYMKLNNKSIDIYRNINDDSAFSIRIRIWVYK